ncbi:efflux transporter outer membrane subunit [Pseudomonas donghuensis]|uniref:efflux transporter outer membrane subunit n=1 Tax=Pseudomonas donghuensis TaxID=1163398 RepID=UPI002160090B|nr:TolC family protein [Pseudomonas donghuensis]UVL22301.1 TolC family protein [Pseudomonas donghuensis]
MGQARWPLLCAGVLLSGACSQFDEGRALAPAPRPDVELSRTVGTHAQALPQDWWSLYHDPQLDRLVQAALAHNRELAAAQANVQVLLGGLRSAAAGRWPTTRLGYGYRYGRDGDDQTLAQASDSHADSQWQHEAQFALDYELDLWGRVAASIVAARADAEAAQAARDGLRVNVAAQTTRAYLRVCALGARREVQLQSVAVLQGSLALTRQQQAAGVLTALDISRQQSLLEQTRALLPRLQGQRQAALFELAVLSGQPPQHLDQQASHCQRLPSIARPLPVGDAWSLLQRRPDIRQAERQLFAARARIDTAKAQLYPQVQFGAALESSAATFGAMGDSKALTFAIGPMISWRFPNRAQAHARVEQAHASSDGALARFDSVVLGALRDVEQALALYAGERQQRAALARATAQSQRAFELVRLNLDAGAVDGLELLDSQRTLVRQQAELAEADLRLLERQVELFRALGGGWQRTDTPQSLALHTGARP